MIVRKVMRRGVKEEVRKIGGNDKKTKMIKDRHRLQLKLQLVIS